MRLSEALEEVRLLLRLCVCSVFGIFALCFLGTSCVYKVPMCRVKNVGGPSPRPPIPGKPEARTSGGAWGQRTIVICLPPPPEAVQLTNLQKERHLESGCYGSPDDGAEFNY